MKVLLVGASGLLGRKLLQTIPAGIKLIPTYHSIKLSNKDALSLDIVDKKKVHQIVVSIQPDLILHCASLVYVDYCQTHQQLTWDINVNGTKYLLDAAAKINARFLFCSSNGVFDGTKPPYNETDTPNPVNVYGKTKYAAEQLVTKQYQSNSIVFRLNTMYGWNLPKARENPASWIIKRLQQKKETYMVTDVYNSHLWVGQAAHAVWKAIEKKCYGQLFHIGGGDCMNRYTLSKAIAHAFDLDATLIHPVTSDYFPDIAPRSPNTCFDVTKMITELGIQPISVHDGLRQMKQEQL